MRCRGFSFACRTRRRFLRQCCACKDSMKINRKDNRVDTSSAIFLFTTVQYWTASVSQSASQQRSAVEIVHRQTDRWVEGFDVFAAMCLGGKPTNDPWDKVAQGVVR